MSFRRVLTTRVIALIGITILTGAFAIIVLRRENTTYGAVVEDFAGDLDANQQLRRRAEQIAAAMRSSMIAPGSTLQARVATEVAAFRRALAQLHVRANDRWDSILIGRIESTGIDYINAAMSTSTSAEQLLASFDHFEEALSAFAANERAEFDEDIADADKLTSRDQIALAIATLVGILLSVGLARSSIHRLTAQYQSARLAEAAASREAAARQEVLAIVSHDLRNPLNTISLGTSLLSESVKEPESTRQHVRRIAKAADRANSMIEAILDTARIEAGTLALHRISCDANALLDEVLDLFHERLAEQQVEVERSNEASTEPVRVTADPVRVYQVLSNLLANALKFTPKHGRIIAGYKADGDYVTFQIRDNGPGIPEDRLTHLFDRYWQGEERRRHGSGDGLGLGLFICKNVVEALGGRIWVESTPGKGAQFSFTLPRAA